MSKDKSAAYNLVERMLLGVMANPVATTLPAAASQATRRQCDIDCLMALIAPLLRAPEHVPPTTKRQQKKERDALSLDVAKVTHPEAFIPYEADNPDHILLGDMFIVDCGLEGLYFCKHETGERLIYLPRSVVVNIAKRAII